MSIEKLRPNEVSATLFVGMGGIGSKIIKGIATRAMNDKIDAVRYCVLDTDVNDLTKLENGAVIEMIQTSSPRSIKDYLSNDHHAKRHWFPENRIIDDKTVSEGAGQIRAISRLAVNATIRQGNIHTLYRCIDDLYLKDGANKKQAIKVVIASTAAGGTGSGIAMITAMLIRQYIKKNYPESAAIIRGLLLLPGVMDTVIDTESERESLRRNGYATIKEINAFMMKGSGFFDSVPELKRYKDLHISVPTTASGNDRLECLPFDFCFLMDRADSNQGSMQTLNQYIECAAQSLYEQNIGPMKKGASSKEDNIVKEFINPDKLGRCRFGGVGASVLRYPYAKVREYIACDWLLEALVGLKSDDKYDEEATANSWLVYDLEYEKRKKEFESNPYSSAKEEPKKSNVYMELIENENRTDDFTVFIRDKNLQGKIDALSPKELAKAGGRLKDKYAAVANNYIDKLVEEAVTGYVETLGVKGDDDDNGKAKNAGGNTRAKATSSASKGGMVRRYGACRKLDSFALSPETPNSVKTFAKGVFANNAPIQSKDLASYSLERYLSVDGKAIHPNAVRFLLYKLYEELNKAKKEPESKQAYIDAVKEITEGPASGKNGSRDKSVFNVTGNGAENNLEDMANSCDSGMPSQAQLTNCNNYLEQYANAAIRYYTSIAKYEVVCVAIDFLESLIPAYEALYDKFAAKVYSINKKKESIIGELRFRNGDIVRNVCGSEAQLVQLRKVCANPASASTVDSNLFADIYNGVKKEMVENQHSAVAKTYGTSGSKFDIFEDVILEYFVGLVQKVCGDMIDVDILRALKLEHEIMCKINETPELIADENVRASYIRKAIEKAQNLAAPSIINNDFGERREVSAITCSDKILDGNGLRVNDFLARAEKSDTVSRYELRFFRSLYNVMPTQLSKFCDPEAVENGSVKPLDLEANQQRRGEYFRAYQAYMEDIGPDCKKNAVITPHVDKRWNSISVMPELDLDYQHALMMNIHQAFFYGIVFRNIERYVPSKLDKNRKVFRYSTGRDGYKALTVSNGTECDLPYEVLDALYFDRAAVKALHKYEADMRNGDAAESRGYFETKFFKDGILKFSRDVLVDSFEAEGEEKVPTSLFELPLIYYNSLPPQKKDAAEIESMVDSIIYAIEKQVSSFMDRADVNPYMADFLSEQFNRLVANYEKFKKQLGKDVDITANDVVGTIRKRVVYYIEELDVSESFINKIAELK